MKHLFITLTISAASIFNTAKATETITPQAIDAFRNTYTRATEVNWKDLGTMYRVSFVIDGRAEYAYYNTDGSWLGTTKNLSSSELSPRLQSNLKKRLSTGYISELFEVTGNEGEVYYAVIENADAKLLLKSTNGKKWSLDNKLDK